MTTPIPQALNARRPIRAILADRLAERRQFAGLSGWLWSLYNRALLRKRALPGRGAVRRARLRNHEHPFFLRLGTSDWLVLQEVFIDGEYDTLLTLGLQNVGSIVDLGANIGLSVRLWQERFPGARVLAVEPDPGNMDMCRRNTAFGAAPELFTCCVAGTRRRVSLTRHELGAWAIRMSDATGNGSPVDALTLSEILDKAGLNGPIDLLKCDIEGAEREVFEHAAPWLPRVRTMVVELHAPYGVDDFRAAIRAADPSPWNLRVVSDGRDQTVVLATRPSTP